MTDALLPPYNRLLCRPYGSWPLAGGPGPRNECSSITSATSIPMHRPHLSSVSGRLLRARPLAALRPGDARGLETEPKVAGAPHGSAYGGDHPGLRPPPSD